MQNSWSLRDEILAASQRWPLIALYGLIGALLGWGLAYLLPVQYQATRELYVGLDAYRAFEDHNIPVEPLTAIDYKNWQLENLELLSRSERVLTPLLDSLRQQDPGWGQFVPADLLPHLSVHYRNAGTWRMVVQDTERARAVQLVEAWQAALLPVLQVAQEQSRQVYVLDFRLQATAEAQAQAVSRLAQLDAVDSALSGWGEALQTLPVDQPLTTELYWQGRGALELNDLGESWAALLAAYPAAQAPAADYQDWLAGALAALDGQSATLQAQAEALQAESETLKAQYASASQASLALSANLVLEPAGDFPTQVSQLRPAELMAVSGALLGLCAWVLLWLGRVALRGRV